jgi:hypothetical protein
MSMLSVLFVMLAFLLFLLSATARWWRPTPDPRGPFYPVLVSAGLAFLVLGVWLIPLMVGH